MNEKLMLNLLQDMAYTTLNHYLYENEIIPNEINIVYSEVELDEYEHEVARFHYNVEGISYHVFMHHNRICVYDKSWNLVHKVALL